MKKTKIKAGKFLVVKKNGSIMFSKKANKNMIIEGGDDMEVTEKVKLTKAEKGKQK